MQLVQDDRLENPDHLALSSPKSHAVHRRILTINRGMLTTYRKGAKTFGYGDAMAISSQGSFRGFGAIYSIFYYLKRLGLHR